VINEYAHDTGALTQGLLFQDGILYEGTGLHGQSSLRKVDLETGRVLQQYDLAAEYFGEGITIFGERLYQLTWKSRTGFVYSVDTLEQISTFSYTTEGWGLTHDGERLIMSDGSSTLFFLDPETLDVIGQVQVRDGDSPVDRLNELEYVNGQVWANVWQTHWIVRIDPASGQVVGWIDLTGLLDPADVTQRIDVLNGIAYDADQDRIFVTGKWWPRLFEIEILPRE
jgi:glutamine cyclotransferase